MAPSPPAAAQNGSTQPPTHASTCTARRARRARHLGDRVDDAVRVRRADTTTSATSSASSAATRSAAAGVPSPGRRGRA
nr:hypothetical protein [Cellulosimicrobium sp. MM]